MFNLFDPRKTIKHMSFGAMRRKHEKRYKQTITLFQWIVVGVLVVTTVLFLLQHIGA